MKYISIKLVISLLLITSLPSCMSEEDMSGVGMDPFFDLENYIGAEVERLSTKQQVFKKNITYNNTNEEKEIAQPDYVEELSIFSNSNINKVSWLDKYEADSTYTNSQLSEITYTALSKKLKTRKLTVYFANEKVQKINLYNQLCTALADSDQYLEYNPSLGFSIKNIQKASMNEAQELMVQVAY